MSSDMEAYLKLLSPLVRSNVQVIEKDAVLSDGLYHISTNPKIPIFTPVVSVRTLSAEDRSVPRVCTAPTIIGCLKGYQAQVANFHDQKGLTIYALPFEEALQPSSKILPDVKQTDEHWLVPYTGKYAEYPSRVIGRMFMYTVKYYSSKSDRYDAEFYVEALEPLYFTKTLKLEPGLYRLILAYDSAIAWDRLPVRDVAPLTKAEYNAARDAGKVNIKQPAPPSSKW